MRVEEIRASWGADATDPIDEDGPSCHVIDYVTTGMKPESWTVLFRGVELSYACMAACQRWEDGRLVGISCRGTSRTE